MITASEGMCGIAGRAEVAHQIITHDVHFAERREVVPEAIFVSGVDVSNVALMRVDNITHDGFRLMLLSIHAGPFTYQCRYRG